MQGRKQYQEKLFVNFQLSDRVSEDNFYRRLNRAVDFTFLYKSTAKYYGKEGQKSIDPVVCMKLMLVGYMENINSDRRIIDAAKMRLDVLYFIGYDIDEELPWHSTLSRTRQLYGQEVFTQIFKAVLKQCIDKGMVSGKRQAIDGVYVKANASLDSMVEREIMNDAEVYNQELEANKEEVAPVVPVKHNGLKLKKTPHNNTHPTRPGAKKPVMAGEANKEEGTPVLPLKNPKGLKPKKNPHNNTHYSPTDPDAKMSVKPGKATALNYLGEVSVDTASHMITYIEAFTADNRDSQCLAEVIEKVVSNLKENDLAVEEVLADTGFSSGEALKALEENNIVGYIPNRPQFIYERPGFIYNREGDYYTCRNNKQLTYRGTYKDPNGYDKYYRAGKKVCDACPLKKTCTAYSKKQGGKITDTIDRPHYIKMHLRMQTKAAKRRMKERQSTVEPVIGTLVNFLGMKRVNTHGLGLANKCVTLAAVAYNLKKLLKHSAKTIATDALALKKPLKGILPGVLKAIDALRKSLAASANTYCLN
jgi:transposase